MNYVLKPNPVTHGLIELVRDFLKMVRSKRPDGPAQFNASPIWVVNWWRTRWARNVSCTVTMMQHNQIYVLLYEKNKNQIYVLHSVPYCPHSGHDKVRENDNIV